MNDRQLFGKTFKRGLLGGDSWKAWKSFLATLFHLPMDDEALEIFRKHTGRQTTPQGAFTECWVVAGRRSGKSQVAALVGVYLACFRDYSAYRAPGETLVLPIIAPDRKQCQIILRYVCGLIDSSPMLQRMVKVRLKESVELMNGVEIRVATASYRTVRGYTAIGCVVDEAAFLRSEESAIPDTELIAAIMPALSTIPGALLLAISSPHARKGELWRAYKEHFGKDDSPVLIWQAPTTHMNPGVNRAVVAAAYLRDRASAAAEWDAQFRTDIESFLPLEVIEQCVIRNRRELPPLAATSYFGFCDPSGGRSDSMTLGIAHAEKDRFVLDLLSERHPPFNPESVVKEFADTLKRYRVFSVCGDRYSAEWVASAFQKCGVQYKASERSRSELYLELLPGLTSGQVELLDHSRLVTQLASLERRTSRGAKDSVDHGVGGHDDVANAAAGALVLAAAAHGGVLGFVELLKQIDTGEHPQLDPMAKYNAPPSPESKPASEETRMCSARLPDGRECGGVMRPHPANVDKFTCGSCGACELICRNVTVGMSRGAYLTERAGRDFVSRGVFGRFGR
jgi:hypothetical protein